jgi:hypothetical protein
LQFQFRKAAYQKLRSTLLGKTILFTDHGEDRSDEQIVLGYRAQHHVEDDFRQLKNPLYLSFRPTFHWTDQKLRVHAFSCVLALMMLNLLRRKLAHSGIALSMVEMMKQFTTIQEVFSCLGFSFDSSEYPKCADLRSDSKVKGSVNFRALIRRDFFRFVRELDSRS